MSLGDWVLVGLAVCVGGRVEVARGVLVGGAVGVGKEETPGVGSSVGVGDGVASMPLHETEIKTITVSRHNRMGSLIFIILLQ